MPRTRMAPTPVRVTVRVMRVARTSVVVLIPMKQGRDSSHEEQHCIYNAECKTSFQHRTSLFRPPGNLYSRATRPQIGEMPSPVVASVDNITARHVGDAAEVVDTCNQGAENGEVDEGDEVCIGRGAMVGEEGKESPG